MEDSIARAVATAGGAVVFAGATVIIALAALAVTGIPFLTVMGPAAAAPCCWRSWSPSVSYPPYSPCSENGCARPPYEGTRPPAPAAGGPPGGPTRAAGTAPRTAGRPACPDRRRTSDRESSARRLTGEAT
ncbi:MMPL family transporter [Streptomyces sp. SA15]|uniref:MMPL family transporter n=1 Tax=Streptomyces sp. SA15 TaxID=934019 RepID=UPI00359C30C9